MLNETESWQRPGISGGFVASKPSERRDGVPSGGKGLHLIDLGTRSGLTAFS
jgi:hypothetical protein